MPQSCSLNGQLNSFIVLTLTLKGNDEDDSLSIENQDDDNTILLPGRASSCA